MDTRKEEEIKFHDMLRSGYHGQRWDAELEKTIKSNPLWRNMKYYAVERKNIEATLKWYRDNCIGKSVLDYCCGNGWDSMFLAKLGAEDTMGIDISEVSIENCRKDARKEGVEDKARFMVMDAEAMSFENDTFDIITEYGSLHHLNLVKAYSEMSRVLKPDGKAICTEALAHNPVIHLYRKLTPKLRTEWEVDHILKKQNIYLANEYFHEVNFIGFFHLATLAAVPFRNTFVFNPLLSMLERADSLLLNLPILKWQAWQVVFELSRPRNHTH